jgi:hypothetical protein
MVDDEADALRERAYLIWEREGRPEGRADLHWEMAREELATERNRPLAPAADPVAAETVTDMAGPSTTEEQPADATPRRRRAK